MNRLTAVSVYCRGRTMTIFVKLPVIATFNGSKRVEKVIAPVSLINRALDKLGCKDRGMTFSIG